jgi:DNA anti-recombination protein RmuC
MSELDETPRSYSGALLAAIAIALVFGVVSLIWIYVESGTVSRQQKAIDAAIEQNVKLAADLRETDARLKVATQELGASMGLSQKQMEDRAQDILRREEAQEANSQRLENAQKQTAQQVSNVSSEVSNVKTDVGGVKTDLGKTQNELATTISQLTSMHGDMDGHSTLIARNHDELELLKHRGDRNYYEFTLVKGQKKPVGTISLQLKKADTKKSRFTVVVFSDDKQYEKKDRNLNEPLQFYSGKTPMLFEIVVNNVNGKNQVSGYLSVPKGASAPSN